MMVANQYVPVRRGPAMSISLSGSPVHDARSALRATEGIGTAIHRVVKELQQALVYRQTPDRVSAGNRSGGQFHLLVPKPQHDLTYAAQFIELCECQAQRLLDPLIGIHFEFSLSWPDISDRRQEAQFPTARFLPRRFISALSQQAQFKLAHGAFEAEQQPVV